MKIVTTRFTMKIVPELFCKRQTLLFGLLLFCIQAVWFYVTEVRSLIRPLARPEEFRPIHAAAPFDDATTTAWCILDKANTFGERKRLFQHFPHAAQALMPCWSYFERVRQDHPDAQHCGIWLNSTKLHLSKGYVSELVSYMDCSVTHDEPFAWKKEYYYRNGTLDRDGVGTMWLEHPDDAVALRKQVLGGDVVSSSPKLRIGLVQRKKKWWRSNRAISNLDEIQEAIEQAFPSAEVSVAYMEDMSFVEQARWWNRQSIVVTAHGASVTNAVFMQQDSAVIQIYPDHYYPIHFFGGLTRAVNVRDYGWFNGVENPLADFAQHMNDRSAHRNVNLRPPVSDILQLVQRAVRDRNDSDTPEAS